jgi:hypothetical protein
VTINSWPTGDSHGQLVMAVRAIVGAAAELARCPDIDSVYKLAVEVALNRLGVERCAIFVIVDRMFRGTYGTNFQLSGSASIAPATR